MMMVENEKELKGVAIGESNFKMLIESNCYYIDKTLFVKHVIDNSSKVALITRPRRFGKTLNMSMLRYFLDCSLEGTKKLFDGLKIMDAGQKYTNMQNNVPCIYLTFKNIGGESKENVINLLKDTLYDVYSNYRYLLQSAKVTEEDKRFIQNILNEEENSDTIKIAIKRLSKILYEYYDNSPVMILLDEYDVPLQNAYINNYYDEAVKFFKNLFSATFKDNQYMYKTVLTGVSKIAKESIFSGTNNFDSYSVLSDNEFSSDFGASETEVKEALKYYSLEKKLNDVKFWYDGYKIGDTTELYNPWSLLQYLKKKELREYWVNTSSNDLIKLVLKNSVSIKEKLITLMNDEEIEVTVNEETIIRGIENNEDNIWGLFLGTGYLKVTGVTDLNNKIYRVKIPNNEIKQLFKEIVVSWFKDKVMGEDLRSILSDLINLRLEDFEKKFKLLAENMLSYMDVGKNTTENFYHAFMLGMLVGLKDTYYVHSNRESGFGRYDIMLEPKDKTRKCLYNGI